MGRIIHTIPTGGDEPLHFADAKCWCFPTRNAEELGFVMIHNAKDCRERFERQGLEHNDLLWVMVEERPPEA